MSAGPITSPWLKQNAPALLQSWWGGEEGGHALADILLGHQNPAGRLPHTVYASEAQVPSTDIYDISQGFTYMYLKGEPLYAFGHGLSYTSFAYENLKVTTHPLTITATIKNIGNRAGEEVAQLYLTPPTADTPRPQLMLRSFTRFSLQPGEAKEIKLVVPDEKLTFWNPSHHAFEIAQGTWQAHLGSSSQDLRLKTDFTP